ncbi:MAG: SIS domain-containing protein [Erysipelotrichaceae bacterium]
MLKFNEQRYLDDAELIRHSRKIAEEIAETVHNQGYSNIFFTAVGGSLAPMMAIKEIAKQLTTIPVFLEQAGELIALGNKNLNSDSLVITLSKSGDTIESVKMAEWCKDNKIRVICCTKDKASPLGQSSNYFIPMLHHDGVEYEYILLYWLFMKLLNLAGDFDKYQEFAEQLGKLPEDLVNVKKQFDSTADILAKQHFQAPIQYWIGGSEMWGETYLFSMCILEEMQWIKTKSVTSSEFFHGTLELIEKDTSVFLIKGEGKGRVLDERVQDFVEKRSEKFSIIDTAEFELPNISSEFRWLMAPLVCSTCLVDRLAFHFEKYTGHDLDIRRYYRQFSY